MVQIPQESESLLYAGIVYLVTEGLKVVGAWFGLDLSKAGAAIAAGLVAALVALFNGLLGNVPVAFGPVVQVVFNLLIVLLSVDAGPMTLWGAHGNATSYYLKDPEGNQLEIRCYAEV